MKFRMLALAAVATLATMAPAAAATYVLNFTATTGSPLPTTTNFTIVTANVLNMAGGYDILSASGSFTTGGNTFAVSLAPPNPPGFFTDNVFFAGNPSFTNAGLGLLWSGGSANLWGNGPEAPYTFYVNTYGVGYTTQTDGTLSVTAGGVPEPGMWMLMITGFGMVGVAARRGRRALAS